MQTRAMSSALQTPTTSASYRAASIDHPRLDEFDAESVRKFLSEYDQYAREIIEFSQQLQRDGAVTTEPVQPVSLKFCVNVDLVESLLTLGLIENAPCNYDELTDEVLRTHLDSIAEESEITIYREKLDLIVEQDIRMSMKNSSVRSRMQALFLSYSTLLRLHGVAWVLETNTKVDVSHVISANRPHSLTARLEYDLKFRSVIYEKTSRLL